MVLVPPGGCGAVLKTRTVTPGYSTGIVLFHYSMRIPLRPAIFKVSKETVTNNTKAGNYFAV